MPSVSVGQRVRAPELRGNFPTTSLLLSDITFTNVTTYADVPGLTVLVEPNSRYAMEGYFAYESPAAAAIVTAFAGPPGCSGHWATLGRYTGGINARRGTWVLDEGLALDGDDSNDLYGEVLGYLATAGAAGMVRVRAAQAFADIGTTTIRAGSWLRLIKLA